ncbi:MAG: efflux RND transporter periplasmic adaptor subunit [Gammaproteobacteria bacterium]|nr:efflux RND transporter periplasmic adaptor subunit [Gammaproteobacteria bacterium]
MNNRVLWRRHILLAVIAVLIGIGLFYGFRPQPVAVDVGVAIRGPLRVTIEQEGRTRVVDRYVIASPVAAYARRIDLDVGSTVQQGASLVRLEPQRAEVLDPRRRSEAEAMVAAARATVSAAEQNAHAASVIADLAQKELARIQALRAQGHLTADAEDRAVAEAERSASQLRSAQFAVDTARYEMEAAKTALRYAAEPAATNAREPIIIRAPVAGRVLKIPRKSEGVVAAGQALMEIGDPSALEVEVDVLSADAVRLGPGTKVEFERWGGDGALEGSVRLVEPAGFTKVSALGVEEQRVWVIVSFTSPATQWQPLGDGYRVEASFVLWQDNNVLQVPASALFREGDGWALFQVQQDKAVKRVVQVGQRNGLSAQILSGVNEGDRVIVHPDDQVRDGVRVVARSH